MAAALRAALPRGFNGFKNLFSKTASASAEAAGSATKAEAPPKFGRGIRGWFESGVKDTASSAAIAAGAAGRLKGAWVQRRFVVGLNATMSVLCLSLVYSFWKVNARRRNASGAQYLPVKFLDSPGDIVRVGLSSFFLIILATASGAYGATSVRRYRTKVPRITDFATRKVDWTTAKRVVDIGCGRGVVAIKMAAILQHVYPEPFKKKFDVYTKDHLSRGIEKKSNWEDSIAVFGIDIDSKEIAKAKTNAMLNGSFVDFVECDAKQMPFDDASVDLITAGFTFFVIPEHERPDAVRETVRILKPGGQLVVWDTKAWEMEALIKKFANWEKIDVEVYQKNTLTGKVPILTAVKGTKRTAADQWRMLHGDRELTSVPFQGRLKRKKRRVVAVDDGALLQQLPLSGYVSDRLSDLPDADPSPRTIFTDAGDDRRDLVYGAADPEDAPQASIGRNPMDFDAVRGVSGAMKKNRPAPELTRRAPPVKLERKPLVEGEVELPDNLILPPGLLLKPPQHLSPREPKEPPV